MKEWNILLCCWWNILRHLVVGEDPGDDDHGGEDDPQVEVVIGRLLLRQCLDGVGHEAEDRPDPQEEGESAKQVLAELDPLGRLGRRRQSVGAISLLPGREC